MSEGLPVGPSEDDAIRDVNRLLTLVDAIVAIAITLLVLPLVDLANEIQASDSVSEMLRDGVSRFGAFALTFVVIARLWSAQHAIARHAVRLTTTLSSCLIAWALTIVFMPFPSALLADTGSQAATKVLYIGTLAVSSALLTLLALIVGRQGVDMAADARSRSTVAALIAVASLLALAVSVALPATGYTPLILLLLVNPAEHILRRLHTSSTAAARGRGRGRRGADTKGLSE